MKSRKMLTHCSTNLSAKSPSFKGVVGLTKCTIFILLQLTVGTGKVQGFQPPLISQVRRGTKIKATKLSSSNDGGHSSSSNNNIKNTRQTTSIDCMDNIERIYAISDLHTDNVSNLDMIRDLCTKQKHQVVQNGKDHNLNFGIRENDAIIIAGDISHEISKLKQTLTLIKQHLNCHIFFIWGNHEAWIGGQELDSLGITTSLQKINVVKSLCHELGIHTECKLVGSNHENPAFVLPIESWYDATLSLPDCEDLCTKFGSWRWVDFVRCVWPDEDTLQQMSSEEKVGNEGSSADDFHPLMEVQNTGQIPMGLTELLYHENEKTIKKVQKIYNEWIDDTNLPDVGETVDSKSSIGSSSSSNARSERNTLPGLITYSHFLPNQKTLPDWKEPQSDTFLRSEWLDHPVPDVSAKFAKVAGSILIDEQIRKIIPSDDPMFKQSVQHLHVFGHSHRPKDFVYNDVRYIHNPLGKPAEREMNMVANDVGFQLIWDCTKQSKSNLDADDNNEVNANDKNTISSVGCENGSWGGEIPGLQIIRYWEEHGGGKKVLARKMKHRRQRRRLEVKRFVRDLELSKNGKGSASSNSDKL